MRIKKFGWLVALVALAAFVGAVAVSPRSVSANTISGLTKTCVGTGTTNVFTCTLTINTLLGIGGLATANSLSDTYGVTVTGPVTLGAVTVVTSVNPLFCTATIVGQTPTSFTVNVINGPAAGCLTPLTASVTVTETVTVTGPVTPQTAGVAVTQSVSNGFSSTLAGPVTATGLFYTVPTVNAVPTSVTKACTTAAITGQPAGTAQVGQTISCTVTATFASATGLPAQQANVTNTNATPATAAFNCPAGTSPCIFTETLTPTLAGTIPTESIVIGGTTFTPLLTGIGSVLAAGPLPGATGIVSVIKTIVDANGNAAPGNPTRSGFTFTVNCGSGASAMSGQGTSDGNGVATISNVPAGNCTLRETPATGFEIYSVIPANVSSDIGNGGTINVTAGQTLNVAVRNSQAQTPTEPVRLVGPACNAVSLTWPQGTPVATVAASITPQGVLEAIWRFDAVQNRFLGFSPNPNAPSDYVTANRLESVFICVRAEATLNRPII